MKKLTLGHPANAKQAQIPEAPESLHIACASPDVTEARDPLIELFSRLLFFAIGALAFARSASDVKASLHKKKR